MRIAADFELVELFSLSLLLFFFFSFCFFFSCELFDAHTPMRLCDESSDIDLLISCLYTEDIRFDEFYIRLKRKLEL